MTITDERMTRFMITLEQGVELVLTALADASFGNIYVKKIPSMNIVDIAETVAPGASKKIIGIRAGEKLHEQMIGAEDANFTYDCGQHYVIVPGNFDWYNKALYAPDIKKVPEFFTYSSDDNTEWMSRVRYRSSSELLTANNHYGFFKNNAWQCTIWNAIWCY